MREYIDIVTEQTVHPPKILYHGTKADNVPLILQHGLLKDRDSSWKVFGEGIYLTHCWSTAKGYGDAVLAIDIDKLDAQKLVPDDDDLFAYFEGEWGDGTEGDYSPDEHRPDGIFNASWIDSLRICSQCQYLGDIPPDAISKTNF